MSGFGNRDTRPMLVRRLVQLALGLVLYGASMALMVTVGAGTVLYAVSIGSLAHVFIPLFTPGGPDWSRPPPPVWLCRRAGSGSHNGGWAAAYLRPFG